MRELWVTNCVVFYRECPTKMLKLQGQLIEAREPPSNPRAPYI